MVSLPELTSGRYVNNIANQKHMSSDKSEIESRVQTQFTIGVFGIIFDSEGKVLLVHRTDYDLWNLPGGRLENNEVPWEGVKREIKEETGFESEVIKLVGVSSKRNKNDIVFTFLCKITNGQAALNKEADKIEYFEINKIPPNTVPKQVERIKDVLQNPNEIILKIQTSKSAIELIKEGKL